jgi:hypothetical protein
MPDSVLALGNGRIPGAAIPSRNPARIVSAQIWSERLERLISIPSVPEAGQIARVRRPELVKKELVVGVGIRNLHPPLASKSFERFSPRTSPLSPTESTPTPRDDRIPLVDRLESGRLVPQVANNRSRLI